MTMVQPAADPEIARLLRHAAGAGRLADRSADRGVTQALTAYVVQCDRALADRVEALTVQATRSRRSKAG